MTNVNITTQSYFGTYFYNIGISMLVVAIPITVIRWYVGLILFAVGAVLISTVYKLEIDLKNKTIDDYLFLLGQKKSLVSNRFESLRYVTLKKGRYSQQLNYKSISTVVEGEMYSAYLYTDSESYYLGEAKRKKSIEKKARGIASKLQIDFRDEEDSN